MWPSSTQTLDELHASAREKCTLLVRRCNEMIELESRMAVSDDEALSQAYERKENAWDRISERLCYVQEAIQTRTGEWPSAYDFVYDLGDDIAANDAMATQHGLTI